VGDPPQLLLREQREEADPGKECRMVLIQPENQLSATYVGFLRTPIVADDTDISTAICEDSGTLGLRRAVRKRVNAWERKILSPSSGGRRHEAGKGACRRDGKGARAP
jgi:hypothetical protein